MIMNKDSQLPIDLALSTPMKILLQGLLKIIRFNWKASIFQPRKSLRPPKFDFPDNPSKV